MIQPVVRLATIEDLPWIRALWREMLAEQPPAYPTNIAASIDAFTRSIALALVQAPPQAFVFLAQLPGSDMPDAFFAYEIQQRQLGEPARLAFIHYIYTRPSARGHGLATTILELAGEHMAAHDLTHVEATAAPGDTRFLDFGFEIYEHRAHALTAGFPAAAARRRQPRSNGHDPTFDVPPPLDDEDADDA